MPRVLNVDRCPHCKEPVESPAPRSCPHCGGSIQQRYLSWGCFTSKPMILLAGVGLLWFIAR